MSVAARRVPVMGAPVMGVLALVLNLDPDGARAAPGTASPNAVTQPATPAGDSSIVDFRLRDQFGREYDATEYRGRAFLLVGAGRGGRAAGTAWVETLRGLRADAGEGDGAAAPPVIAVADLRGVPRLLRGVVRGRFPDDPRHPVLLDWSGSLARRLSFDASTCTIVIVAPSGRAHARTSPAAVDTAVARELLRRTADLARHAESDMSR